MTPDERARLIQGAKDLRDAGRLEEAAAVAQRVRAADAQATDVAASGPPIPTPVKAGGYSPANQFYRGAMRGTGQLVGSLAEIGANVGENVGLLAPGTAQGIAENEAVQEQYARNVTTEVPPAGPTDPGQAQQSMAGTIGKVLGTAAPALMLPGGGASLLSRVGAETTIGAGMGMLEYAPNTADRLSAGARDALLGGASAGLLGAATKLGNAALGRGLAEEPSLMLDLAARADMPMTTGQILDSPYMTAQENLSRVAGGRLAKIQDLQEEATETYARGLLGDAPVDPLVSQTRGAVENAIREFEGQANRMYAPINKGITDKPSMDGIRRAAQAYIDRIDADLPRAGKEARGPAYKTAEKLLESEAGTFRGLRELRKNLIDSKLYAPGSKLTKAQKADMGQLRQAITDEMRDEAYAAGLEPEFLAAEDFFATTIKPLQEAIAGTSQAEPTLLARRLLNRPKQLAGVYKTLDDSGKAEMRQELFGYVRDQALTPDNEFSLAKFRSLLGTPSKSAGLRQMLSPDEMREFNGMAKLLAHLNKSSRRGQTAQTGQLLAPLLFGVGADAVAGGVTAEMLGGDWYTGAAAGAALGGLAPQLWNNPAIRTYAIRANRLRPGTKAMDRVVSSIENALSRATAATGSLAAEPSEVPLVPY